MSRRFLGRWCSPRTVLVVMAPHDDPAQVLTAIRHAELSGARLLLAQMSPETPAEGSMARTRSMPQSVSPGQVCRNYDSGQSALMSEILRRAFVLNGVSHHQLPALVRTFNVDRVLVTQRRGGERLARPGIEERLISMLAVPVWVMGRGMALNLGTPAVTKRILLPVSHSPEDQFALQFAWELATSEGASLSVLHVYRRSDDCHTGGEKSPLALKSWLPIDEFAETSSPCAIEIAVREGEPAAEILEFNSRKPHDLVILRPSPARRSGLPSKPGTMSRLCSQLPCPMLILGNLIEEPGHRAALDESGRVRHLPHPNATAVGIGR